MAMNDDKKSPRRPTSSFLLDGLFSALFLRVFRVKDSRHGKWQEIEFDKKGLCVIWIVDGING